MSEVRRLAIVTAIAVALAAGIGLRPGSAQSNGAPRAQDPAEAKTKDDPPRTPGPDPVVPEDPFAPKPEDAGKAGGIPPILKPKPSPVLDPDVVPAQAPGAEGPTFEFPRAESLPEGAHAVGLTVDVQGPKTIYLNKTGTLWIIVKNSGTTDALGVGVREKLPDGLEFVDASLKPSMTSPYLFWDLKTMSAGKVERIKLTVKATKKVASIDHAPIVTMMTGGRSRISVREPRLRVEQRASVSQALKGESIQFDITVTNTGDGPAKDVTVAARLGSGLKYENGDEVKLRLADLDPPKPSLAPGESVTLDPLMVQAFADGEHACTVTAESPDVAPDASESKAQSVVRVVAPKLSLDVKGPIKRFTDRTATYHVVVENTGSAVARNSRVAAHVVRGAELVGTPKDATWNKDGGFLRWDLGDLEPKKPVDLEFTVLFKGVQRYSFPTATTADTLPRIEKLTTTEVVGISDVSIKVSEPKRVIDVGESTVFTIKLVNRGSSEAKKLVISAVLTDHLDPEGSAGTDQPASVNKSTHVVIFPVIETLAPGAEASLTLSIQAKAVKAGYAKCNVELRHDDLGPDGKEEDSVGVRVTEAATPAP